MKPHATSRDTEVENVRSGIVGTRDAGRMAERQNMAVISPVAAGKATCRTQISTARKIVEC